MSLTNPELDMKWWNSHLQNDKKYSEWAKKNLKLAKAIGHLDAATVLRLQNPGGFCDAAKVCEHEIVEAQRANKDKDLKVVLEKFLGQAKETANIADDLKRHMAVTKMDEKTQKLADKSSENAAGR